MKTLKSAIMNGGLKAKLGAFLLKDSLKGMKRLWITLALEVRFSLVLKLL